MTPKQVEALLRRQHTITPAELCATRILPLCQTAIYDAIRRGDIESISCGWKKAIPTAPLRRKLGLTGG